MSINPSKQRFIRILAILGCLFLILAIGAATKSRWLPLVQQSKTKSSDTGHSAHADGHEGHDHDHAGHDEANSLELSPQARRNLGLTDESVQPIKLSTFTRTLGIPARVVEIPGRTLVQVASPMTGVVASLHVVQGEAIQPGTLLFKVRLTHEDLVQAQSDFLKTLGELDVENREITRLTGLDKSGVIAGKRLLERQYSKQKLEAVLNANRESLLLHGLSSDQIAAIVSDRRLLKELEVRTPALPSHELAALNKVPTASGGANSESVARNAEAPHLFMVQSINVNAGSMVSAGKPLAVLADLDELYIEGRAFEHDADEITHASRQQSADESGWDITAVLENNDRKADTLGGLKIVYIDNKVESDSRAQLFYVDLPNQITRDTQTPAGHRFLTWRFKPGQRLQLRVPIEQWKDRIVLPVDALAQEGAETFVFLENGDHFDQRPVHVEYQDQLWVVIANDGSLFPGDTVALTGAHQMQVAIKNKAGGGVDPHAGHNH